MRATSHPNFGLIDGIPGQLMLDGLANLHQSVAVTDTEGTVLWASPPLDRLLGDTDDSAGPGLAALCVRYLETQNEAAGGAATLHLPPVVPAAPADLEVLDEWAGKQRLAAAGIAVPEGRLVDAGGAPAAAVEIGFPVAVKRVDPRIPHKSEAGALRLGLTSADAVAEAVSAIAGDRFLVERMVDGPVAELLVGIRRDDAFGQVMVLASGGVLVELVGDARTLLLPTDRDSIVRALAALKVSTLLAGYRGAPAANIDAVVDVVMKVAAFAEAHRGSLEELDINPLIVQRDGAVAADVLLRMKKGDPP